MGTRVTVPEFRSAKGKRKLVMVTAYDAVTARWASAGGVDAILVGDSVAMVCLGHPDTLSVTLDQLIHHAKAVAAVAEKPLVVGDMPFGSYQLGPQQAVVSAVRFIKEAGVQAVKLEGPMIEEVKAITRAGIPVMGHLGLTPQWVNAFGGFRVRGRKPEEARQLLEAAKKLEEAGCFSLVLEAVPKELAAKVTESVGIPTIGIGAGPECDGQVLVMHDMLGMTPPPRPKFVRSYCTLSDAAIYAIRRWAEDVRRGEYPQDSECYH